MHILDIFEHEIFTTVHSFLEHFQKRQWQSCWMKFEKTTIIFMWHCSNVKVAVCYLQLSRETTVSQWHTVPAARLKVLPFMELWTGENQFNTEPTRGICLIIPYTTQRHRRSNILMDWIWILTCRPLHNPTRTLTTNEAREQKSC